MEQWFNNLKRNEQLMLMVGGAFLLVYLLFMLLWQPVARSADNMQQQNEISRESLQKVRVLAEQYAKLKKSGTKGASGTDQSLTRTIDKTIKKNKLTMSRFQPSSSGDVQVRFENASFSNILAWLHELENDKGILVKDLSISPGVASGLVNISVRLRQGA